MSSTSVKLARAAGLLGVLVALVFCPQALAANVYVSSFTAGTVSQYSVAADGTLVALSPATVASGAGSEGIALRADRASVYVANNTANTAAQFSVAADGTLSAKSPATVAVTRPVGITVTPDGKSAYVTSQTSGLIAQFSVAADGTLSPKSPATIAAPVNEGDVVVNAAGTRAYVGDSAGTVSQFAIAADGTLSALSPATVASGGSQSTGLGLSPDGSHLYVANRGPGTVSWMAIAADGRLTLQGTIAAQAQTNDVTVSPDGHSVYGANQNASANSISQYTVAADGSLTNKVPALVSSPSTPKTVVFSTDGKSAYVPHQNSADLGLFSVSADGTLTAKSPATVAAATGPFALVYSDGPPVTTGPPTATTGAASAITDTTATVAGTVNPNGVATYYTFEYGTSTSFGAISPVSSAGAGSDPAAQTASLTGLTPNTTYYYRLVASSSAGDSVGTVHTFKTTGGVAVAPAAVTQPVTGVTTTSGVLHGQVNPRGSQTAFTFEYGTTTSFGAITPVVALDDADALEPVSATLSGLAADTTYYYRVVAANAAGTTSGAVLRFSTGPGGLPAVTTGAATDVTASAATLAGTVDAHGAQTAFAFEYGTTTSFGSLSAVDNAGDSNAVQQITLPISGLSPGTTYLYRLIATNPNGTSFGIVQSLTTAGSAFATGPAQRTIATGQVHSCVVRTTGEAGCWGTRFRGFFGDGLENGTSPSPVNATGLNDAVEIGAGFEHTCALRANGQVYCWGISRFGQRGDGTLVDSDVPAPVSGITDAVQLSVGAYSSCAVRATGQVMCWGENGGGQLGNGTTLPNFEPSPSPTTVVGLTDAVQVSIGRLGACAVRVGGKVSCWGSLGSLNSNVPVEKAGVTDATQVTVGSGGFNANGWACAVRAGGGVLCWGVGAWLGDGGSTDSPDRGPSPVVGITDATQVTASATHTCVLRVGGQVACWGENTRGELGNGQTQASFPIPSNPSTPVAVVGLSDAVQISAGDRYTCATRQGGTAVCWGDNSSVQGAGGADFTATPLPVFGLANAGRAPAA